MARPHELAMVVRGRADGGSCQWVRGVPGCQVGTMGACMGVYMGTYMGGILGVFLVLCLACPT